jgi:hypothetical protein
MNQPKSLRFLTLTLTLGLALVLLTFHIGRGTASAQTTTPPSCGHVRSEGEAAIIGHINAQSGTVSIPELNLTTSITSGAIDATHQGCFEFRDLAPPQDPMLISFKVTADGFRPTTWMHDVWDGGGPDITLTLEPGTEAQVFDPCPNLIANPQTQSAAIQQQATLCAKLLGASLPNTGSGYRATTSASAWIMLLLAFSGVTSLSAGMKLARRRRHWL